MYVVEKLRLNKYVEVSVPRNKDLFERMGGRVPPLGTTGFTSELGKNKMEILSDSESALLDEFEQSTKTQK